jgi:hypothetical protein
MIRLAIACVLVPAGVAAADPEIAEGTNALVRARLPNGPDQAAPGLGASVEGGWGGARAEALGAVSAEALLYDRITVRAGVTYDVGTARPAASASYEIYDPFKRSVGLLAGVAFKTEGLTEAEGEVEVTLAVSRRVGDGLAAASITYGQDADFKHHDAEAAVGLVEPIMHQAAVGGIARVRSGLGSATELGANWDALAGAAGRVKYGPYALTAIGGTEIVGETMGGTKLGALVTLALGAWW